MSANDNDADDKNLFDISDVIKALEEAQDALRRAMGGDERERERFLYQIGFARGRLSLVCDRVYPAKAAK